MKWDISKRLISVAVIFFASSSLSMTAGTPTEVIRLTADGVLNVLKDPALKGEQKSAERREKLKEIIYPRFDFPVMSRRSLGPHWRKLAPEEQREFVKLFTGLLETSYADKIDSYDGEKVLYTGESIDKNFAEVSTKVVTKKGEEFSVNYKLSNSGGEWKIYDVVIEHISLVNNYRSQFHRVLNKSSFEELLGRMKAKQFQAPTTKPKT